MPARQWHAHSPQKIFCGAFLKEKPRREKQAPNDGRGLSDGLHSSPTPIRFLFFGSFFSFPERKERTEHPVSFPERKERTEHPVSFPERRKRTISDPRPGRAAGGRRARAACRPSPAACCALRMESAGMIGTTEKNQSYRSIGFH